MGNQKSNLLPAAAAKARREAAGKRLLVCLVAAGLGLVSALGYEGLELGHGSFFLLVMLQCGTSLKIRLGSF